MSDTPLVSIVIPTYNRADDLRRALDAVQKQDFRLWEVVIVDNHSTDDTDQVVAERNDGRMRIIKIHNNGVIAKSRNKGIQEARGKYIALLDSDDWWTNEKLSLSVQALENGADIVYHDLWLVSAEYDRLTRTVGSRQLHTPVYEDLLLNGNALPNSSVVVRKNILEQVGGLSEETTLIAAEDFDCWLRIARITEKFTMLPGNRGYYLHVGAGNSSAARKVVNIKRLFELHFNTFIQQQGIKMPVWILYNKARAHFVVKQNVEARSALRQLLARKLSFMQWVKVTWMLLQLALTK